MPICCSVICQIQGALRWKKEGWVEGIYFCIFHQVRGSRLINSPSVWVFLINNTSQNEEHREAIFLFVIGCLVPPAGWFGGMVLKIQWLGSGCLILLDKSSPFWPPAEWIWIHFLLLKPQFKPVLGFAIICISRGLCPAFSNTKINCEILCCFFSLDLELQKRVTRDTSLSAFILLLTIHLCFHYLEHKNR